MAKLVWDQQGEKLFETGVKNCVLYPINKETSAYDKAVAWNGITGITESPEGAEASDFYADDIKYATLRSAETFKATIEAYMYPDEFALCDGTASLAAGITIGQQPRSIFGLSYVTSIGNDTDGQNHGYKIHLIYGASASPSEKSYSTINDSPDLITFSWEVSTTPVAVTGHSATACVVIDSTKVDAEKLKAIEDMLYGTESAEPKLPLPDEIAALFA